jgi:biopolymer transport protein ExbB
MTFTVEGFFKDSRRRLCPPALLARLRESINAGNYQEAWTVCQANRCFVSTVVGAALERIGRGKDQADFAVQEASLREGTLLKMNITYLSVIGVVSPMIGLTGTVTGMIKAFTTLGASGISNTQGLASAIGEVLVCTATGLMVAIPAFVFFYILKGIATGAILVAESEVYRLLDEIPFDQISGLRIGENFNSDQPSLTPVRSGTSQKVSRSLTTNCPQCNAAITPGVNPCPNCGVTLEWDN